MRLITMNRQARRLQRAAAARRRPVQAPFTVTHYPGPRDDSHLPFLPPVPPAAGAAEALMTAESKNSRQRRDDRRVRAYLAMEREGHTLDVRAAVIEWLAGHNFDPPASATMPFGHHSSTQLSDALARALAAIYYRSPEWVAERMTMEHRQYSTGVSPSVMKLNEQLTIRKPRRNDRVDAQYSMYGPLGGGTMATQVVHGERGIPMPDFDSRAIIERVTAQAQRIVDGRS